MGFFSRIGRFFHLGSVDKREALRESRVDEKKPVLSSAAPTLVFRDVVEEKPLPVRTRSLSDPKVAAAAVGELLGDSRLGERLGRSAKPETLKSLAMLLDDAFSAPDYRALGPGFDYPNHRAAYREHLYNPRIVARSSSRRGAEVVKTKAFLDEALSGGNPSEALDTAVRSLFLRQIGVNERTAAQWKTKPEAVQAAIAREWLVPLKALNETAGAMAPHYPEQRPALAEAVQEVTRHIVEGDFSAWRATSPTSLAQVEGLEAAEVATWRRPLTTTSRGPNGVELTTREETGPDLLWTTKIGGPSHGHDYGGQALLPLLANLRTTPIIVDDPRYSANGAARSYLRLLPRDQGGFSLYLEPTQRDFPHRDRFGGYQEDESVDLAILGHAVAKAKEMNLPLSLSPWQADRLATSGLQAARTRERYVLEPSGGVFEASDTLTFKHDWPNVSREVTGPIDRLVLSGDAHRLP